MKKSKPVGKTAGKQGKAYVNHFKESNIVSGLVVVTVYAQFASLFGGVGLVANLILIAFCVVIAIIYKDELIEDLFHSGHICTVDRNGL